MTLGNFLRLLREARRVSQSDLASACKGIAGIGQTNLSRWERDDRYQPSARQLSVILRALKATPAEQLEALRIACPEPAVAA